MEDQEKNLNDLAEKAESLFERAGENEEMWNIASKYAMQLDQGQIYILSLIKYFARMAHEDTKKKLDGFVNDYLEMQHNRNTAMFIARLAEFDSLKRFIGSGMNVQIEKK